MAKAGQLPSTVAKLNKMTPANALLIQGTITVIFILAVTIWVPWVTCSITSAFH